MDTMGLKYDSQKPNRETKRMVQHAVTSAMREALRQAGEQKSKYTFLITNRVENDSNAQLPDSTDQRTDPSSLHGQNLNAETKRELQKNVSKPGLNGMTFMALFFQDLFDKMRHPWYLLPSD